MPPQIKEKFPLLASESNQREKKSLPRTIHLYSWKTNPSFVFLLLFFGEDSVYTAMSSGNMKTCTRLFLFMVHVQLLVNPVHCLLEENEIKNSNDPPVSRKYFVTFFFTYVNLRCNRTPYQDVLPNNINNKIMYYFIFFFLSRNCYLTANSAMGKNVYLPATM